MAKRNHYTVFLLKAGIADPSLALSGPMADNHRNLDFPNYEGHLYLHEKDANAPDWAIALQPFLIDELQLMSNSLSAVVACFWDNRWFLIAFGYGWTKIDLTKVERDFGKIVTLNLVQPGSLRTIDSRTFEGTSITQRSQASSDVPIEGFGLDVERNLISAVGGRPDDVDFWGSNIGGRESLKFSTTCGIAELQDHFTQMIVEINNPEYRRIHEWVDFISEEKDPDRIQDLRSALTEKLRLRSIDDLSLIPPKTFDHTQFNGLKFSGNRSKNRYEDLDWAHYFDEFPLETDYEWSELERQKIQFLDSYSGRSLLSASVSMWIYSETVLNDCTYVLSEGNWYQVNHDFLSRVDQTYDSLIEENTLLPACEHLCEPCYNKQFEDFSSSSGIISLDRREFAPARGESRVEVCDLLTCEGRLIHVKVAARSSLLSHLFNQGLVSAQLLKSSEEYRQAVRARIQEEYPSFPYSCIDTDSLNILYVVIKENPKTKLPVFSRISLHYTVRTLRSMGVEAKLTLVTGGLKCETQKCVDKRARRQQHAAAQS